jgi:hypothetical protein
MSQRRRNKHWWDRGLDCKKTKKRRKITEKWLKSIEFARFDNNLVIDNRFFRLRNFIAFRLSLETLILLFLSQINFLISMFTTMWQCWLDAPEKASGSLEGVIRDQKMDDVSNQPEARSDLSCNARF